jgi:hydrogenase maturation factor HypF (carbamoyltransferase family)
MLLLQGLIGKLEALGFTVYAPVQLPANDGGIALGQAAVAGATIAYDRCG